MSKLPIIHCQCDFLPPARRRRIPDSELEGSVELRIPDPQPSRPAPQVGARRCPDSRALRQDPLFPPHALRRSRALRHGRRRRLRLGLSRRPRRRSAGKDDGNVQMLGIDGKVMLVPRRGEAGRRRGHSDCLARRQMPVKMCRLTGCGRAIRGDVHVCRVGQVRRRRGPGRCLRRLPLSRPGRRELSDLGPFTAGEPRAGSAAGARDLAEIEKYFDVARRSFAALSV